jgi:hypothetical protein
MITKKRASAGDQLGKQPTLIVTMVDDGELRPIGEDVLFNCVSMEVHEYREVTSIDSLTSLQQVFELKYFDK